MDKADKILTISIAAYNVEAYLEQALESCVASGLSSIEVLVVDDGSTDDTPRIADAYAERYPHIVRVIHKQNGGYGTTINASLAQARGRYYRLLDGDDWFDPQALATLVDALANANVDVAITPYVERIEDGPSRVVDQAAQTARGCHQLRPSIITERLSMHSCTFRTDLLREAHVELPARRLYTDTLFVTKPLVGASTCLVLHDALYQYRLGRDGQSMSVQSLIAHHEDLIALVTDLGELYGECPQDSYAQAAVADWLSMDLVILLPTLFSAPPSDEMWERIEWVRAFANGHPQIARACDARSKSWRKLARVSRRTYPAVARVWPTLDGIRRRKWRRDA